MEFKAYHNSHDLFYRKPFGAVTCGQRITFRIKMLAGAPIKACLLRLWEKDREITLAMARIGSFEDSDDRELIESDNNRIKEFNDKELNELNELYELYEVNYQVPNTPGLIWYYFVIRVGSQTWYYGNNLKRLGGEGSLSDQEPPSFQITVYKQAAVPEWYKRGVMYQVFVDRFFNDQKNGFNFYPRKNALLHANWSDPPLYIKDEQGRVTDWDFFGGTLQGVLEKLLYFKELGISILYFNPIFDASSNHKYDTADYLRIDPMYGDDSVFEQLINTAQEYGISVILDGVFSHTGSDSIYFNKYANYPGLGACQSADSPYFNWYKFKPNCQDCECWWGVDSLPEVDEMNPSYRQFIYGAEDSVIQKWLNLGVAGWRLDVADELPDEFIQELRQAIKSVRPDAVLIGEVWEDASNKISYGKQREYFLGNELDATMNYPFRTSFLRFMLGQGDARDVHQEIMSLYENYPRENFSAAMNLIGSHDTIRILTLLGEAPAANNLTKTEQRNYRLPPKARQLAIQRLKLLSLVQMTFPGVPCIYYGDEAGVEGYADPYNRGTYPWGKEDGEIMAWYRRILRLRAEYEVLRTGDLKSLFFEPDVYGYRRAGDDEEIIILINRHSEETITVDLSPIIQPSSFGLDLLSSERLSPATYSTVTIRPLEGKAFLIKDKPQHDFQLERSCGVLLHISSLPSAWGLGDLGKEAYEFVDFLSGSGQSLWQVLPLNPTGVGDCPYQSESVFAGNTMLISLDHLIAEGLLNLEETRQKFANVRGFGLRKSLLLLAYKELKYDLLSEAYQKFLVQLKVNSPSSATSSQSSYLSQENYRRFTNHNQEWLDDYVLFRALKTHFGDLPWYAWEPDLASRQTEKLAEYSTLLRAEMGFIEFLQYTFFYQWDKLKLYANSKDIQLIGDLPHFVAADSCDVWVNRDLFVLDEQGRPTKTAGVPPDYFSKTGQLWGNPVYDWDTLADTQYDWWQKRIRMGLELFDYIRLDHFRGFEAYWEVEAKEETAEKGSWIKGPGKRFFESLLVSFGKLPLIIEDLGVITPEVKILQQLFGFPGIKVLQFTPLHEIREQDTNFVYYSGTHDNNTLLGWYTKNNQTEGESRNINSMEQTNINIEETIINNMEQIIINRQACRKMIEELYMSPAAWVILPMQDILGLGEEARMNVPGTIHGNWQWQLAKIPETDHIPAWICTQAEKTGRSKRTKKSDKSCCFQAHDQTAAD